MMKPLLALSVLIFFPLTPSPKPATNPAAIAQDAAPAPAATPTPPDTKNPVKPTAETKAKAKKLTLTDFTDPKTLSGKSDAELFDIIKNGKDKMPPEDASRAKPGDIWNLVLYIRGMAK
jgi:Cytochrome C oxidase, cbb3-type, subunit III